MIKNIVAILMLGLLTGCVAPWSKQDYAGITYFEAEACPETLQLCHLIVIDGKEGSRNIEIRKNPDGTFSLIYGSQVLAFEGQRTRAEVEKFLAQTFGELAPGVLDRVIRIIEGGGVPEIE